MVLSSRRLATLLLVAAALITAATGAAIPADGLHPLAWMAAFLPLQLVALLWALLHSPVPASRSERLNASPDR